MLVSKISMPKLRKSKCMKIAGKHGSAMYISLLREVRLGSADGSVVTDDFFVAEEDVRCVKVCCFYAFMRM